ncbi:MOSC N-terminal beta barrel domain-containing protein [Actinoplanes sp. NEAU-A12]|uniref:MOSC N-terminal beta barrel domain-containing protein n=1 Tax=Actinoplanes sandaracinus TaxID=3045177 RepID=A0ABT6WRK8_9ACTN|nr:MOSC N-terminal beta barrel domain-containing protein [Actinoplanes sandaracinus]MDI6102372.1 MOSC N-terminal beta barrel domain-containing protein [Actinoplanes sandaracinus]
MLLTEIRRFPVKSMLGELVSAAEVTERGLAGDRAWAVRDPDGKFGSGKNTRRFRRMPGLFGFRAQAAPTALPPAFTSVGLTPADHPALAPLGHLALTPADHPALTPADHPAPIVELPDGRRFAADDPAGHRAISEVLGRTVTLTPEAAIPHHDEGPVSLITSASLRALTMLSAPEPDGTGIDPLRFRANLLIDLPAPDLPGVAIPGVGVSGACVSGAGISGVGVTGASMPGADKPGLDIPGVGAPGISFPEDGWPGRHLRVGAEVVLRVVRPLIRCVMIDMPQDRATERGDLLKALATHHEMTFGVFATVENPGRITTGDECRWL